MLRFTNTSKEAATQLNGITLDGQPIVLLPGKSVDIENSSLVKNYEEVVKIFDNVTVEDAPAPKSEVKKSEPAKKPAPTKAPEVTESNEQKSEGESSEATK